MKFSVILFFVFSRSVLRPKCRPFCDREMTWFFDWRAQFYSTSKMVGIFNTPKIAHWLCSKSPSLWLCSGKTTACMLMRSFYISNRIACDVCARLTTFLFNFETTDIFPEPATAAITWQTKVEVVTVHCHKTECTKICISFSSFSFAWVCASTCVPCGIWAWMIGFTALCFFGSNAHTIVVFSANGFRMWVRDREHRHTSIWTETSDLHHIVHTHARCHFQYAASVEISAKKLP